MTTYAVYDGTTGKSVGVQAYPTKPERKAGPMPEVYCRHCGAQAEEEPTTDDWLCTNCERYQDQGVCPTCGSVTRLSALPEEMRPEPVQAKAPKKSRKEEVSSDG